MLTKNFLRKYNFAKLLENPKLLAKSMTLVGIGEGGGQKK